MKVVLERKQSSEINFSIYKTINGTVNFTNKSISFTDDLMQVTTGAVNYRIRLDIAADTSFYLDSLVIAAPLNCTNPTNFVQLKENPINNIAHLLISRAARTNMHISIVNAVGQSIYENSFIQNVGAQIKAINMQAFSAGIYYIKVFADNKKIETLNLVKR